MGHSRDRSSGGNLKGMGAAEILGRDTENAHVDERKLYHYHGISRSLYSSQSTSLIVYTPDRSGIHNGGPAATSSWQLKSGTPPTATI